MANFDLFFGRFQPFHNGHLAVLDKMKNPVICIVRGKKSSKKKNPFDTDYQRHLILKARPDISIISSDTGYLPDIIQILGDCPGTVYAGSDRINQYRAQVVRANKNLDNPMIIRFIETDRVSSGTVVREAIRSDNKEAFMANVPREIWDEYSTMKERLENV